MDSISMDISWFRKGSPHVTNVTFDHEQLAELDVFLVSLVSFLRSPSNLPPASLPPLMTQTLSALAELFEQWMAVTVSVSTWITSAHIRSCLQEDASHPLEAGSGQNLEGQLSASEG